VSENCKAVTSDLQNIITMALWDGSLLAGMIISMSQAYIIEPVYRLISVSLGWISNRRAQLPFGPEYDYKLYLLA